MEIWFGIANEQILSMFGNTSRVLFAVITSIFGFHQTWFVHGYCRAHNFSKCQYISKYQYISIKLALCTGIIVICFGAGLGGSFGCASNWRPGGCGFDPHRGRQHSFVEIDHEICHSLPSADSSRADVSFWRKNVHNTG